MVRFARITGLIIVVGACSPSIAPLPPKGPIPVPAPKPHPELPVPADPKPAPPLPAPVPLPPRSERSDSPVRVALSTGSSSVRLSAIGGQWSLYDRTSENFIADAQETDVWTVEREGGKLKVRNGSRSLSINGPLVVRPQESTVLKFGNKRYRGELVIQESGGTLIVVNRLAVETYLRGVVPLEIGTDRTLAEMAAVAAQAVAARSYTYSRLNELRPYDLGATVMDQVYGGVDAERAISDEAIESTRGLVLMYNGKIANTPYHSNSGGATASASEVWRSGDTPYLVSVSDRIPGTDRFYCEDSPRFRWTRTFDAASLVSTLNQYLSKYNSDAPKTIQSVTSITESGRTASGRIAGLVFETDKGRFAVRGNDIRFVLRSASGDILPSTLFSFEFTKSGGKLSRVVISGTGNGHGVGMDQWGAISRARSGQDYFTILRTYYPGTTLSPVM